MTFNLFRITGPQLGWRWPFVIGALPAIGAAALMMIVVDEPRRGATEAALQGEFARADGFAYAESITWPQLKQVLRIPTNLLMILQGLPGEFCTAY